MAPYESVVTLFIPHRIVRDDRIIVDSWPAPTHAVHPPGVAVVKVMDEA